jgi:hypothetical protein
LLLVVTGCTDGLLVPEPEGVDDPEPETNLCGTDGNDPCEMDEVVVEEIWDPPPAFPDPIDEPLPGGPDDPGSIPTIPPDDPDDGPVPVRDEPVSKAEVVELIRDACSDVSGVTLPGDDGRLGDYFESSVRKSLNDALPEDRKFNYDLPDTDTHPRLTADVDGYATAVTVDGAPLSQFLSAILEAKFSERPSNSLPSDQWQDHIDDLSRSYNEMRNEIADDEYTIAKPQYLIVTNSQFSDIGDLGGDQSIRIPSYAASRNVNVMHLRVTKNAYGQYRLSGDLIGTADTLSFLADLLKDIDIPFSVECNKNR